jgi:hypothetical protein
LSFLRLLAAFPERGDPLDRAAPPEAWGCAVERADPQRIIAAAGLQEGRRGAASALYPTRAALAREVLLKRRGAFFAACASTPPPLVWVPAGRGIGRVDELSRNDRASRPALRMEVHTFVAITRGLWSNFVNEKPGFRRADEHAIEKTLGVYGSQVP